MFIFIEPRHLPTAPSTVCMYKNFRCNYINKVNGVFATMLPISLISSFKVNNNKYDFFYFFIFANVQKKVIFFEFQWYCNMVFLVVPFTVPNDKQQQCAAAWWCAVK